MGEQRSNRRSLFRVEVSRALSLSALVAALLSAAFVAELPATIVGATSPSHAKTRMTIAYDAPATPPERIPVKEPIRVRPTFTPVSARPTPVRGVRPLNGRYMSGPRLLRPDQIDIIRRAQLHVAPVSVRPVSLPTFTPGRRTLGSARVPASGVARTLTRGTPTIRRRQTSTR